MLFYVFGLFLHEESSSYSSNVYYKFFCIVQKFNNFLSAPFEATGEKLVKRVNKNLQRNCYSSITIM